LWNQKAVLPLERDGRHIPTSSGFGDFSLEFHPHLHILVSDGCFHENGFFSVSPTVDTKAVEQIFRHKMLLAKGKITRDMIALLVEDPVFSGDKWRHSGFNVSRILPRQEKSMSRQVGIARYIIRASFSRERMTYLPDEASARCQCLPASGGPRLAIYSPHMTNSRDPVPMIRLRFGFFGGTSYIKDPEYPAEAYF